MTTKRSIANVRSGDRVIYNGRPHVVNSVKLGEIAGPHVRMSCEDCPPTCDAGTLTSVQLIRFAPND